MKKALPISLITCLLPIAAQAQGMLESSRSQAHLVELYSSEGCSSCPPADEWMASLRQAPGLWSTFVPIEFHVDYWNRLGWTDRFSREDFTRRQSKYAAEWGSDAVYTPGRVLDGREWKDAFDRAPLAEKGKIVGRLSAQKLSATKFRIRFKPETAGSNWTVFGALLGNGLKSVVKSGENSGRTLKHEFVAFGVSQVPMKSEGDSFEAELELKPAVMPAGTSSASIAIWVSRTGSQIPVQAVGGDL